MLLYKILGIAGQYALKATRPLVDKVKDKTMEYLLKSAGKESLEKAQSILSEGVINELVQNIIDTALKQILLHEVDIKLKLKNKLATTSENTKLHKLYQSLLNAIEQLDDINNEKDIAEIAGSDLQKYIVKLTIAVDKVLRQSVIQYYEQLENLKLEETNKAKLISALGNTLFDKITELDFNNPTNFYRTLSTKLHATIKSTLSNPNYNESLLKAANSNDKEAKSACRFLALGADVNALEKGTNIIPLMYAIKNENFKLAQILLEHGADPNLTSTYAETWKGWPLLAIAIFNTNTSGENTITRLLLDYGANPNAIIESNDTWKGWTPLCIAVHNWRQKLADHRKLVELLLKKGANPNHCLSNTKDNWAGWTPLMLALRNRHNHPSQVQYDVVQHLLTAQANPNHTITGDNDWCGWTPLCMAVHNWRKTIGLSPAITLLLLQQGSNPNHRMHGNKDKWNGWTPLALAIRNRHEHKQGDQITIITYLLHHQAIIQHSITDEDKKTRDMLALAKHYKIETIFDLLEEHITIQKENPKQEFSQFSVFHSLQEKQLPSLSMQSSFFSASKNATTLASNNNTNVKNNNSPYHTPPESPSHSTEDEEENEANLSFSICRMS